MNDKDNFEEDLLTDVKDNPQPERKSFFKIQTLNNVLTKAAKEPIPRKYFDVFFHEGDLAVMFANTDTGKSILAVQIASKIASEGGLMLNGEKPLMAPQKVLYCNFELTGRILYERYSHEDFGGRKQVEFSENLFHLDFDIDEDLDQIITPEEIRKEIEYKANEHGIKVIIIDNLGWLAMSMEKSSDAAPLMKELDRMKKRNNFSILVIAHTPKRDDTRPIIMNDLAGSRQLMNYMDTAFAVGQSHRTQSGRYLKQIKIRHTSATYDRNNVLSANIINKKGMTLFDFSEPRKESFFLRKSIEDARQNEDEMISELFDEGLSLRRIAERLDISKTKIDNRLKAMGLQRNTDRDKNTLND